MVGIELPAALALLLRADLRGPAKREGERLLQCRLALDLAADVADDPAQPAAQDAQLPLMPLELFGMSAGIWVLRPANLAISFSGFPRGDEA
jgi:hypothetical protein